MSPEKQQIAIAEICGWKDVSKRLTEYSERGFYDILGTCPVSGRRDTAVPNYPASLDAMHEATMTLKDRELRNNYINHLDQIICPLLEDEDDDVEREFLWCNATAAQRREALLKTFNRWEP